MKTTRTTTILLLFFLIVYSPLSYSQDVDAITKNTLPALGDLTVGNFLKGVRAIGNALTQDAMASLDQTARNSITALNTSLGEKLNIADRMLQNKLAYAFNQLDRQERRLMSDIEGIVRNIMKDLPDKYDLYNMVSKLHIIVYEAVCNIPGKSKIPLLAAYETPYDVNHAATKQIKLLGAFLNFGPVDSIRVQGIMVKTDVVGRNEIVFTMPDLVLSNICSPTYISVEAKLTNKNWLGLKSKIKQSVSVYIIPQFNYKIKYTINGTVFHKIKKVHTAPQVVRDRTGGDHGWREMICNPYTGDGYNLESYAKVQFFPDNDGNTLTICNDNNGGCVEVCGNTGNGRAQYQIALNLSKFQEEKLKEENAEIAWPARTKIKLINYAYLNDYSDVAAYERQHYEFKVVLEKFYCDRLIETKTISSSAVRDEYLSAYIDNISGELSITIDE